MSTPEERLRNDRHGYSNFASILANRTIGGARIGSLVLFLLLNGCQQDNEFSNLELRDIVFAYQNKGLFQKQDREWHAYKHAGAERGVRFFPYPDEPDKGVELYEFISIRERERSDREVEAYARQRNLPYDPNSSVSIGRFSLYGHRQFPDQRREQVEEAFRSVFKHR